VNGTLAPISGKGITTLNREKFKILSVYKKFDNRNQAAQILNSMKVTEEAKSKALEVWKRNKK
jgi:tRNA 2-selenouridine synthase SelU